MQPIIYDVAVSLDGFISGLDGDISQFAQEGPVVDDYLARLAGYSVAIMGRHTYEFGYRFGMKAGDNPYPHMRTLVFSRSVRFPQESSVSVVEWSEAELCDLKTSAEGPIYLCGGGAFAGWLLERGLVDRLRLKRAPVILGEGVLLFGDSRASPRLEHVHTHTYAGGYLLQEFRLRTQALAQRSGP